MTIKEEEISSCLYLNYHMLIYNYHHNKDRRGSTIRTFRCSTIRSGRGSTVKDAQAGSTVKDA